MTATHQMHQDCAWLNGDRAGQQFGRHRLLRLFTKAPKAFWRHDVDVSLDSAAQMARFANLAGVRSTFYIRATGDEYNPFSPHARDTLHEIKQLGHRLGLHVDANGHDDPRGAIRRDRTLLVAAYPGLFDLERVSFHMPAQELLWRDWAGFESAYASKWQGRYVADSRREFGPEKEALVNDGMQLNLHSEHWFA